MNCGAFALCLLSYHKSITAFTSLTKGSFCLMILTTRVTSLALPAAAAAAAASFSTLASDIGGGGTVAAAADAGLSSMSTAPAGSQSAGAGFAGGCGSGGCGGCGEGCVKDGVGSEGGKRSRGHTWVVNLELEFTKDVWGCRATWSLALGLGS